MIPVIERDLPLITDEQKPTERFFLWTVAVSRLDIMSGTGSPEGVVPAPQKSLYMDESGTAGAILYIKRVSDVAGNKTQGWVLV
jgi:hypothetical protein